MTKHVLLAIGMAAVAMSGVRAAFWSTTEPVPVYVTVTDRDGRLVSDLVREDLEILDNGKPVEVTLFKSDVQPMAVVVMLDTSGSMTMNLELLKQAAESFVIFLKPGDRARVGNFDDRIYLSPKFTNDRDELIRLIVSLGYGNGTRLWDAVDASMTALSRETDRRVVVVFTDGDDTTSTKKFDTVFKRGQNEDVTIYAIGLHSQMPGMGETRPDRGLKNIANETGGGYFDLRQAADLKKTFTRVADELHGQYVLGFTPNALDGKVHKLDVRVKKVGMTARARKSYLANPSR